MASIQSMYYTGEIWKRRFHFEIVLNVFRPQYAGEIGKRNNNRPFWICVWGKRNHTIIVTPLLSWSSSLKWFPSTWTRKVGVFKFLRFGERLQTASFSERISVDGTHVGLIVEKNPAFSISSGVVWTGRNCTRDYQNLHFVTFAIVFD